jgi:hypothetical protein
MDYYLTVQRLPAYVHATGTGVLNEENARRFLFEAYVAAVESECDSLLLDMRFVGPPMNFGSVYAVVAERSSDGSMLKRIAYVDANPENAAGTSEFAELAAVKRGVNVRLFGTIAEAQRWLEG